jgi:hypothetical protein
VAAILESKMAATIVLENGTQYLCESAHFETRRKRDIFVVATRDATIAGADLEKPATVH